MSKLNSQSLGSNHLMRVTVAVLAFAWPLSLAGADYEHLDHAMDKDPEITFPEPIRVFSKRLKPLWLQALAHPEVDLQRQAAETFGRAHKRGLRNLEDVVQPLIKKVSSPKSHPIVRLAAARTLVTLDANESAAALFDYAKQGGLDEAQSVEPALAKWDFQPIRAVWLARLEETRPSKRRLRLAINGLADVGEEKAIPKLRTLVESRNASPGIRLDASRALGRLQTSGLESLAKKLMDDSSPRGVFDRLVAASLLAHHESEAAFELLEKLASDREPTIAAVALKRLLESAPKRIVAIADRLLHNRDSNVRHLVARAFVTVPAISTIEQLGPILNDPHPRNRKYVRLSLIELAKEQQFDAVVRSVAMEELLTDQWRSLEQATLVLAALDHKPAANRLVKLLEFKRSEVFVTAAWALRKLAVRSTLQPMFDRAERMSKIGGGLEYDMGAIDQQVAHLLQALCLMDFKEAEPLMRQHIPKGSQPLQSRAAAIWALGHFHNGKPDPELAKLFVERVHDFEHPCDPESIEVCRMSAIGLGRMNAEDTLPELRQFLSAYTVDTELGFACGWAIQQITGEEPPKQTTRTLEEAGWFLQPLNEKADPSD